MSAKMGFVCDDGRMRRAIQLLCVGTENIQRRRGSRFIDDLDEKWTPALFHQLGLRRTRHDFHPHFGIDRHDEKAARIEHRLNLGGFGVGVEFQRSHIKRLFLVFTEWHAEERCGVDEPAGLGDERLRVEATDDWDIRGAQCAEARETRNDQRGGEFHIRGK